MLNEVAYLSAYAPNAHTSADRSWPLPHIRPHGMSSFPLNALRNFAPKAGAINGALAGLSYVTDGRLPTSFTSSFQDESPVFGPDARPASFMACVSSILSPSTCNRNPPILSISDAFVPATTKYHSRDEILAAKGLVSVRET